MDSRNVCISSWIRGVSLGALALGVGCGVAADPQGESPESPATQDARAEGPAGQVQQDLPAAQCVTIQRGTLGNVADTQVASNTDASHPSGNFGAGPAAIAGKIGAGQRKALFQWDLSAVPPNLGITSATATLTARSDSQGGPGNTLSVYVATSAWSEGTVNWATQPSYNPTAIASDSGGPGTHTFDLTAQAQAWAGGGNNGIVLDQDAFYYTNFYTSETPLTSNHPALQVCYIPDLCHNVTCTPSDPCHVAGTCDPNTGACSTPAAPNGTACTGGTCTAGACVPSAGGVSHTVNGLTWYYDPGACGEGCNQVCASQGKVPANATTTFNAQNTTALCQNIATAFGMSGTSVGSYSYACLEDGYGNHTVGGGLIGPLLCSNYSGCPLSHMTRMDQNGTACGANSRRSLCACQ